MDQALQNFLLNQQEHIHKIEGALLRIQQSIAALQGESILRAADSTPRLPIEFTSQFGEDLYAWALLSRKTNGFFIEAGAFDGFRFSVTYPLEALGWTGLLVEAIPVRFRQCTARRPYSRVVNAVLSSNGATGNAEFSIVHDDSGGMYSFSEWTPRREKEFENIPLTKVQIPRASLDTLLADHQGAIDLVILDLEGDEIPALNGFNLERFRPRVLIIENNDGPTNTAVKEFMEKRGYQLVTRIAVNEVYIRRDDAELIETLKWISLKGL